jgi:hypothetical protein
VHDGDPLRGTGGHPKDRQHDGDREQEHAA